MKAVLLLILLSVYPSAMLSAPDSTPFGSSFDAVVSIINDTNETVSVDVYLVSPYSDSRSLKLDPGEETNVTFLITTEGYRAGEYINVTILIIYKTSERTHEEKLSKYVLVSEQTSTIDPLNILIGILIVTIGVSIVGYFAMARRKKRESEEERERPYFDRPPRL